MLSSLGDNQMFGAGFGLISVGLAASAARKGFQVCKSREKYFSLIKIILSRHRLAQ